MPARALWALFALPLAALLVGCGETASTGNFKGESKAVAQVISNFRSSASTGDEKAICEKDLAKVLKTKLARGGVGCKKAIEEQLHEVDTFTLNTESVTVHGTQASAKVQSTFSGKLRLSTLLLVKEGGSWKISEAPARTAG